MTQPLHGDLTGLDVKGTVVCYIISGSELAVLTKDNDRYGWKYIGDERWGHKSLVFKAKFHASAIHNAQAAGRVLYYYSPEAFIHAKAYFEKHRKLPVPDAAPEIKISIRVSANAAQRNGVILPNGIRPALVTLTIKILPEELLVFNKLDNNILPTDNHILTAVAAIYNQGIPFNTKNINHAAIRALMHKKNNTYVQNDYDVRELYRLHNSRKTKNHKNPDSIKPDPTKPKKEAKPMTKHYEKVVLIHGNRAEVVDDEIIIGTIQEIEAEINSLEKIKTASKAVNAKVAELKAQIAGLIEVLDARGDKLCDSCTNTEATKVPKVTPAQGAAAE